MSSYFISRSFSSPSIASLQPKSAALYDGAGLCFRNLGWRGEQRSVVPGCGHHNSSRCGIDMPTRVTWRPAWCRFKLSAFFPVMPTRIPRDRRKQDGNPVQEVHYRLRVFVNDFITGSVAKTTDEVSPWNGLGRNLLQRETTSSSIGLNSIESLGSITTPAWQGTLPEI